MKLTQPKPFTFEGGSRAVLLLHGFTGSSADVRMLGRFLEKNGYTSHAPQYKGHGVPPEELVNYGPMDWWKDVMRGYDKLRAMGHKEIKKARRIGMGWMILSVIGAMLTGFIGIAYFAKNGPELNNPETVFIILGEILFHPLITGFLISAILAAIMSTISSQLLVTSSSLTEDIYKAFIKRSATDKELVFFGRLSVLIVSIIALFLSWEKNTTILNLVGYAWAGFGSSFGPLILLSLFWKRMNRWGALAGIIGGAVTVIAWSFFGLSDTLYEIIPGFGVSLLSIIIVSLLTSKPKKTIEDQFDEFKELIKP